LEHETEAEVVNASIVGHSGYVLHAAPDERCGGE
jgi:hypothetical protein